MLTHIFQKQLLHLHYKSVIYLNTQCHRPIKERKQNYNTRYAYLQGTSPNCRSSVGIVYGLFPCTKLKYFPHCQLEGWDGNQDLEKEITWDQSWSFQNDYHKYVQQKILKWNNKSTMKSSLIIDIKFTRNYSLSGHDKLARHKNYKGLLSE
jgi:hypothetical protein